VRAAFAVGLCGVGLLLLAIRAVAAEPSPVPPNTTLAARVSSGPTAMEYWDVTAWLESGDRFFARFLVTNQGPGEQTAAAVGHLVLAGGEVVPFKWGRRHDAWTLGPGGGSLKIAKAALVLDGPALVVEVDSAKRGIELRLEIARTAPLLATRPLATGYGLDVAMPAPAHGRIRTRGMDAPRAVVGTGAVTHTWTERPEGEVLRRRVELLARKPLGDCPAGGGGAGEAGLRRAWLGLTSFPAAVGGLPGHGFLEPTPAVVVSRSKPLIAVADTVCRIEAYEWDGRELAVVWQASHDGGTLSSPAVVFGNLLVIGSGRGLLMAHDVETGVKMWEYDAGEPVLATPAGSSKGIVFVVSETQMHAVSGANGVPVVQAGSPQRFRLPGVSRSSPAVTADCVYVATQEMVTVSHDFKARSHNTGFAGTGLSSPAVGGDGSVYAVARNGAIWKFKGSN